MKVSIAARLKPFSHTPGVSCLIPGTSVVLQAFPTSLCFFGFEYLIETTGPVEGFTVQQDLEKNCVVIFGFGQEGFYRKRLFASSEGFEVVCEKTKTVTRFPAQIPFFLPKVWERLSLGSHKAQDWDLVWRRFDLRDILPVLFGLGQKTPCTSQVPSGFVVPPLREQDLSSFLKARFSHLLVPRLQDDQRQGFLVESEEPKDPSFLIYKSTQWIRSCFLQQSGTNIQLLPFLGFDRGRILSFQVEGIGEISFEWASYKLRKVVFSSFIDGEIRFIFPENIDCCKVIDPLLGTKTTYSTKTPFYIQKGRSYFLCNFLTIKTPTQPATVAFAQS